MRTPLAHLAWLFSTGRTGAGASDSGPEPVAYRALDWVQFLRGYAMHSLREYKNGSQVAFKGKLRLWNGAPLHNPHNSRP